MTCADFPEPSDKRQLGTSQGACTWNYCSFHDMERAGALFGKHRGQRCWLEGSPGTSQQTANWVYLQPITHMLAKVLHGDKPVRVTETQSYVLPCNQLEQSVWGQ